jgi:metal-responsive CopG/Arc/MetJ family transcriptional regulator
MGAKKVSVSFESSEEVHKLDKAAALYKMNRSQFVRHAVRFYISRRAGSDVITAVTSDERIHGESE